MNIGNTFAKRHKDLSGLMQGELEVKKQLPEKYDGKNIFYECYCHACGQTCVKYASLFTTKKKKQPNCGCMTKKNSECKNWKGCGVISGDRFNRLKKNAERRNIEFTISIEHLNTLWNKQNGNCRFSGTKLYISDSYKTRSTTTASLDRIDSSKGYIEGNLQWIHKQINFMKLSMSDKDFIEWCKLIAKHRSDNE